MAIREVRIYFRLTDKEKQKALSKELWATFTFYLDALMRGRFRRYSGSEVKGVNIVNLILSEPGLQHNINSTTRRAWTTLLNTYEFDVDFDYSMLTGTTQNKIEILIDIFIKYASLSPLPQIEALVSDIKDSRDAVDINSIITKSLDYKRKLGVEG